MRLAFDFYNFILLYHTIIGTCSFAILLAKGKKSPLFSSFVWLIFLSLAWCYGYVFEWSSILNSDIQAAWISVIIQDLMIGFIGFASLHAALVMTYNKLTGNRAYKLLRFILPSLFAVMVFTNKLHKLLYTEYTLENISFGPLLIGICAFIMICLSWSLFVLTQYIKKNPGYKSSQAKTFRIIFIIIFACMIVDLFISDSAGMALTGGSYLTIISIAVTANLYCYIALKNHFSHVASLTLEKTVDQMPEAVLVLDQDNNISMTNNSLRQLFGINTGKNKKSGFEIFLHNLKKKTIGQQIPDNLLDQLADRKQSDLKGEVLFRNNSAYSITVKPVTNKKRMVGRVITFSDISEYKQLVRNLTLKKTDIENSHLQLKEINETLSAKNIVLQKQAEKIHTLAAANERNRISRDMHDILGQTMSFLLVKLELGKYGYLDNKTIETKHIKEAISISGKGLLELSDSLTGSETENSQSCSVKESLDELLDNYRNYGINIRLSCTDAFCILPAEYTSCIYKVTREAITNAIRHGKASEISVSLSIENSKANLTISDNGQGCKTVAAGYGLSVMKQRISALMGTLDLDCRPETGFTVSVCIPLSVNATEPKKEPEYEC